MDFDFQLLLMSLVGGLIFGWAAVSLIHMNGIHLPRFSQVWKVYFFLSVLFFISYYGAIYANRFVDGRDIFHSTPTSLIAFGSFFTGMMIAAWRTRCSLHKGE